MSNLFVPEQTIGIIGGGQLGRMMSMAAKTMGFRVGVLDPTEDCPAAQVSDFHIQAAYDDMEAIHQLSEKCSVLTYEFENVDVEALNSVIGEVAIPQGTDLLAITQDRLIEKAFLEENNIIIAPFSTIIRASDIHSSLKEVGFPCVLKTTRGGYDGKGQHVIYSLNDVAPAMNLLREGACVLEAWIPFEKEISVVVAGNGKEEYTVFPVVENIHRNNVLFETIAPARIDREAEEEVKRIALQIAKALSLAGTLCIEMFLTKEGSIYVNELAPRPHNSGHYTIEACSMSQFEAHIRGVCGWPLAPVRLLSDAVMVNILGDEYYDTQNFITDKPTWHFHYYGKEEVKYGRKMGHITILTENIDQTLEEIYQTAIWD